MHRINLSAKFRRPVLLARPPPSIARALLALALGVSGCGSNDEGGSTGPPLPALASSSPASGSANVPRTAWLVLHFAEAYAPAALRGIALSCDTEAPDVDVDPLDSVSVVVNPRGELPPGGTCKLRWRGPHGAESVDFSIATRGEPAAVAYDRDDASRLAPYPDDSYLVTDATTATGQRVEIPKLDRPGDVRSIINAVTAQVSGKLDGFSPLAPLVVEVPGALLAASIPMTEGASMDPLSTVALFDVDPASTRYGQRLPIDITPEDDANKDGTPAHVLVIYPTFPLRPKGQYALVLTRRALVDATRPLERSAFHDRAAGPEAAPSTDAELRVAGLLSNVQQVLAAATPPLRPEDIALTVRVSVRSMDHVPDRLLSIRKQLYAMAPPTVQITSSVPGDAGSGIEALVSGTFTTPSWRDGDFLRVDAGGVPVGGLSVAIPFVLALPSNRPAAGAPLVMYQHGSPGSAEAEVPRHQDLFNAGFAVAGFTDVQNREYVRGGPSSVYSQAVFQTVLGFSRFPDHIALFDTAYQIAFVRALREVFGTIDQLPLGAPDGVPEIDVSRPLGYLGISFGSIRGVGLLPFVPEIHAAALVVGGGRFSALSVKQENDGAEPQHLYALITGLFPNVTRAEFWSGISLLQANVDDQDWLNFARHLYSEPFDLGVSERASVLQVEGLGDELVAVYSTRAAAQAFGLPQLAPVDSVPLLEVAPAAVSGNLPSGSTGAFVQYVPKGYTGGPTPTPGCVAENYDLGHACAQRAAEAIAQRTHFFQTALDGVPEVR